MVELVYTRDLKSLALEQGMRVRVPLPVPFNFISKENTVEKLGFHFSASKKLASNSGYIERRIISEGDTHYVDGFVGVCRRGLHASPTPRQAWGFIQGKTLSYVKLHGKVDRSKKDKWAAEYRTYVKVHHLTAKEFDKLFSLSYGESVYEFNRYCYELLGLTTNGRLKKAK